MNIAAINPAAVGYVTTLVAAEPGISFLKDKAPKHWALEAVLDGAGFGIGATTLAATVSMSIPMWPTVGIGAAAGAILFAAYQGLKRVAVKVHEAAKAKFGWYARLCAKLSEWKSKVLGNSIGETVVKAAKFVGRNVTHALGFVSRFLPWRGLFLMFTPIGRAWTVLAYTAAAIAAAMPVVLSLRPVLTPISSSVYVATTGVAHYIALSGNIPPNWSWNTTVWGLRGLWIGSGLSMLFTAGVVAYVIAQARRQKEPVESTDDLLAKLESHYPSVKAAAAKIDAAAAKRVSQVAAAVTAQPVTAPTPDKAPAKTTRKVEPVNMTADPYSAKLVEHGLEGMLGEQPTVVDDIRATVSGKPLPRTTRTKGGGRKVRPPEPHIGRNESVLVASSMSDTSA